MRRQEVMSAPGVGGAERGGVGAGKGNNRAPLWMAAKRPRRVYGERLASAANGRLQATVPGARISISAAIEAMLASHFHDWSSSNRANCRIYLLSETGRFQRFLEAAGLQYIHDLTTDALMTFLAGLADSEEGPGLKKETLVKYRTHLRALARFQGEHGGYGNGLQDIDLIRRPRTRKPGSTPAPSLTRDEERAVVAACIEERDHLIVELLLATGLRVSEAAGLVIANCHLKARPPRLYIEGSEHDREVTKNRRPRQVPFRKEYSSLPARLGEWVEHRRDANRRSLWQEVFLSVGAMGREHGDQRPLTIGGYEQLCERVSQRAQIHFSPHILRHTWATRLVDGGVQPLHMMEVGGWSSIEMVQRYYTARTEEALAAIAAANA